MSKNFPCIPDHRGDRMVLCASTLRLTALARTAFVSSSQGSCTRSESSACTVESCTTTLFSRIHSCALESLETPSRRLRKPKADELWQHRPLRLILKIWTEPDESHSLVHKHHRGRKACDLVCRSWRNSAALDSRTFCQQQFRANWTFYRKYKCN